MRVAALHVPRTYIPVALTLETEQEFMFLIKLVSELPDYKNTVDFKTFCNDLKEALIKSQKGN